jgi:hypothetical protein
MSHQTEYAEQFERFKADVSQHAVTVLRDDGVYRHLRCSAGSYHMQFDVVTWPGHLCYSGDMGSFVFARLPDMFEFFRGRTGATVDRGYLAEKAVAADKSDGIRAFSSELFRAAVEDDFDQFVLDRELAKDEAAQLWEAIEDDVLSCDTTEHDAVEAAMSFRWDGRSSDKGREVFCDFWERRLQEYTGRFVWCCYAIPWAISEYDSLPALPASDDLASLRAQVQALQQERDEARSAAAESSRKHRSIAQKAGMLRDALIDFTDDESFATPIVEAATKALAEYDLVVYGDGDFARHATGEYQKQQKCAEAAAAEIAQLRAALKHAGDAICSDYCGHYRHHDECKAVSAALTSAPEGTSK